MESGDASGMRMSATPAAEAGQAAGGGAKRKGRQAITLRLIGAFKLLKCAALLLTAAVTLRLAHGDIVQTLSRWAEAFRFDPHNHFVHAILARMFFVKPRTLHLIAAGTFIYAAIFGVEGVGLLLQKRWAEYFTIVSTGLFIPLEIYELVHRFTAVRVIILLLNLIILAYLIWNLRRQATAKA